jgi:outer membrane receptor protein involved in Fe transport
MLKRISASDVDHIDLIRGGAPGIDMQGRTVLANVVRKGGSGLKGVASVADNVFADGRQGPSARLEFTRKAAGTTWEGSILRSIYVDDAAGDGVRVRTDPDGKVLVRSNLKAKAGGRQATATTAFTTPLWGGKFRVNALGFYDRYKDDEDDQLVDPPGEETLNTLQVQEKGELGLHFEKTVTPRTTLEALAIQQVKRKTYHSNFGSSAEDDDFKETDTSGETIGRAVLRFRKSDRFSTEASAEAAYNIQQSDSRFAVDRANVPLPAAGVTVSEKRAELAASATWRPDKRYTLEAGVRAELSNIGSSGDVVLSKTLFFPKPRLVFTWSPDANNQLRLRIEREVGQLDFADFVASSALGAGGPVRAGNPNLTPQNAWIGEAAFERHIRDAVLVVTYRHQIISDVVDRIAISGPSGVFDAPGNIGGGGEDDIDANVTLPLDVLGIRHGLIKAQGNLRHSNVTDPLTGKERHISGQHRFDYDAHFTQDLPGWKANWGIDVYNRWTETYFRVSEVDTYKLKTYVALFIEYKPKPSLSLRAELDNVGGRGYQRVLAVYPGPRGTSPLSYIDNRQQEFGPYLYFRVRKTFG